MITISRRLAKQLRTVFGRAFRTVPRRPAPALTFVATENLLQIRARSEKVAVTFEERGQFTPAKFTGLPELLRDCEGTQSDPVELEPRGDNTLLVRWLDSGIPQIKIYERPSLPDAEPWPSVPKKLAENSGQLLIALRDASETTDPQSRRYALGHIQLRGQQGEIVATDGRQLLLQRGFEFPWPEDLLMAANRAFGTRDLLRHQSVWIGSDEDWVTLRIGPWTLQFAIHKEGRFPHVEDLIRPIAEATSSCRIPREDLLRLQRAVRLLPGGDVLHAPVTVDLNGHLAVRAKAAWLPQPTEIQLEKSCPTGEPIRIVTNRNYLERAAKLGLPELYLFGPQQPLLAQDDRRSYLWMSLSPELVVPSGDQRTPLAAAA